MENYKYSDLTQEITEAFYKVYNTLGYGFLKVYVNALIIELKKMGIHCEKSYPVQVFYENQEVGMYYADMLIENCVIIEAKAAEVLCEEHEFQLINYLKATEIEVGLLLNFGKKPEIRRKVFSNNHS